MTNTTDIDTKSTTSRTLSQSRRMPQWRRLIDSVHLAQTAQGFDGRQFDPEAMEFFQATLIGTPIEHVRERADEFSVYWVERQELEHGGSTTVRFVVKMVRGDNLAKVETVFERFVAGDAPDAAAARECVLKARELAGKFV